MTDIDIAEILRPLFGMPPRRETAAYRAMEAARRDAAADRLVQSITGLKRHLEIACALAELIHDDARDEGFDDLVGTLRIVADSIDECAKDAATDYLTPVQNVLRDRE